MTYKRIHPAMAVALLTLLLAGCPFFGAGYVPDGYWQGAITDAPGSITIVVQDGFVRQIQITGLQLESLDDPDDITDYPIYIDYGFIDGLFPGVEGLPILPSGTFIDHALTEEGSETITGQIAPDFSANGTVSIVLFVNNAPDEVHEFAWTAEYLGETLQ